VVCPGPIVEAKKLLNGMQAGEVLKLISNCPGIQSDITGWAAATRMELVETVEIVQGEYEFYIRKT
jgi:tRNA 2-thiouridine synthesizing protein A